MKRYVAKYDDDSFGKAAPKTVVVGEADSLTEALAIATKCGRNAFVVHVATDLQRHQFDGRTVWLDVLGREHPAPQ